LGVGSVRRFSEVILGGGETSGGGSLDGGQWLGLVRFLDGGGGELVGIIVSNLDGGGRLGDLSGVGLGLSGGGLFGIGSQSLLGGRGLFGLSVGGGLNLLRGRRLRVRSLVLRLSVVIGSSELRLDFNGSVGSSLSFSEDSGLIDHGLFNGFSNGMFEMLDISDFLSLYFSSGDIGSSESEILEDGSESGILVLQSGNIRLQFGDILLRPDLDLLGGFGHSGRGFQLDIVSLQIGELFFNGFNLGSHGRIFSSQLVGILSNFGIFGNLGLEGLDFKRQFDVVDFVSVEGFSERMVGLLLSFRKIGSSGRFSQLFDIGLLNVNGLLDFGLDLENLVLFSHLGNFNIFFNGHFDFSVDEFLNSVFLN